MRKNYSAASCMNLLNLVFPTNKMDTLPNLDMSQYSTICKVGLDNT